jgi:hypothetical protein
VTDRDGWARLTPYEVGIPGRRFVEDTFRLITEEAEGRSVDTLDPGAFALLGQVGLAVREVQGEERGGGELQRYAAFLYRAYHFRRDGEPLFLLEAAAARRLVGSTPEPFAAWRGGLPSEAGYLQLPRHLFWSRPDEEGPAEPLDGIFWTHSSRDTLSLLVALGVRAERPGISVVEIPPLSLEDAARWPVETVREGGMDFATTLPGGEMDALYSVVTLGEALKLAARVFAHVTLVPQAIGDVERAPRAADLPWDPGLPRPTTLPFRRLR